jgi:hypothetical protein
MLGNVNRAGEPIVRTTAFVFKADAVVAVCPKCKRDVPFTPDLIKALADRFRLVLPISLAARKS